MHDGGGRRCDCCGCCFLLLMTMMAKIEIVCRCYDKLGNLFTPQTLLPSSPHRNLSTTPASGALKKVILTPYWATFCHFFAMPAAVHPGSSSVAFCGNAGDRRHYWRPQFQTNTTIRLPNPHGTERSKNKFKYVVSIVCNPFTWDMVGIDFAENVSELPWPFLIGGYTVRRCIQ